jgi:uncharacterized SAM-binding protein YcdF (DUF218 family)
MLRKLTALPICLCVLVASVTAMPEAASATAVAQVPAGTWQLVPSPGGAMLYAVEVLSDGKEGLL